MDANAETVFEDKELAEKAVAAVEKQVNSDEGHDGEKHEVHIAEKV
jgi:hypothetical protein